MIDQLFRFADDLRTELPDARVEFTRYPSGAAMLDVVRNGHVYVMAFSPATGFGVDEVHNSEGFLASYRYVSTNFAAASDELRKLAASSKAEIAPRISLVVLYAVDIERSKVFYETLGLRFRAEQHERGPLHFTCELGGSVFELYPSNTGSPAPKSVRLGFSVSSVDKAVERLRTAGAPLVERPQDSPWGRRAVVRDPDGNPVEISSPIAA